MKRKERKEKTKPKSSCMRLGRPPSPEGTRLMFAGTISPMICPGDGPTTQDQTEDKTKKKEEGRDTALKKLNQKLHQNFYVQLVGQGRHKRHKGRKRRRGKKTNKNITIIKTKRKITKNETSSNIG